MSQKQETVGLAAAVLDRSPNDLPTQNIKARRGYDRPSPAD
jgi:hypothetical protein